MASVKWRLRCNLNCAFGRHRWQWQLSMGLGLALRGGVGGLRTSMASWMILLACHTSTQRVWMDGSGLGLGRRGESQWRRCSSCWGVIELPSIPPTLQGSSGESPIHILDERWQCSWRCILPYGVVSKVLFTGCLLALSCSTMQGCLTCLKEFATVKSELLCSWVWHSSTTMTLNNLFRAVLVFHAGEVEADWLCFRPRQQ